jgi:microcystin-dependent protein
MGTPYLAEIKIVSFGFAPRGWALCNGQLLPINQNQALFALLGTTYGGDGRVNFALPDFRGRAPMHTNNGTFPLGQKSGEENHTLLANEMPLHTHPASANTVADQPVPSGNFWSALPANAYCPTPTVNMNPAAVPMIGGGQPHNNLSPFLTLNFVIALVGIFPSRN